MKIVGWRCDYCNKEETGRGFEVEVEVYGGHPKPYLRLEQQPRGSLTSSIWDADLCSLECVAAWATTKAKERDEDMKQMMNERTKERRNATT